MENIIFYVLIFIIGTLFGSFSTLAVYRIPLHQDITHERSYCPNCNHKLSFFDMIPILSYIFLKGRCRYCKQKIRIRYLLLEVLTGTIFLLYAISLNIDLNNFEMSKIIYLIVGILYIIGIIILAGIDKENRKISKPILGYEIIILSLYMIYLYIIENANIYRYAIYLIVLLILFIIDTTRLKKLKVNSYAIEIIILCIIQSAFSYTYGFVLTTIILLLATALECLIRKILKKDDQYLKQMPIGYNLCMANIITIIIINMIACR